ncbi:hypothetical protein N431DRAFT_51965 [Stipitochalara longipes BDJ]|nr:hypothetical protein N431DRAFT_51965 [Stipitochalara longipes BDJ]
MIDSSPRTRKGASSLTPSFRSPTCFGPIHIQASFGFRNKSQVESTNRGALSRFQNYLHFSGI